MAWTPGRWPLAAGSSTPDNLLTCVNELRSELNIRGDMADPVWGDLGAFAEGDSTWDAIKAIRDKVDGVLGLFYKGTDWRAYVGCGTAGAGAGVGGTINIFLDVFGGVRDAWLNTPPATQATAPAYDPTEGDPTYKTYLNELYSVIDALQWIRIETTGYDDGSGNQTLTRYGESACDEASEQDAVDAAFADIGAAVAAAGTADPGDTANYGETYGGGGYWACQLWHNRTWWQFDAPANVEDAYVYLHGDIGNWYEDALGSTDTNPAWDMHVAISGVSPGALTDADWAYGADAAAIDAPDFEDGTRLSAVVHMGVLPTADQTDYLQLRSDEAKPNHLVGAYWDPCYCPVLTSVMERRYPTDTNPFVFIQIAA